MTQDLIAEDYRAIDELAIRAIMEQVPGMERATAVHIYWSIMLLRRKGLEEIDKQERSHSTIASVITSEVFFRMLILVAIPLLRLGYAPLVRVVSRVSR
jgi:hypothetical protein